ncbi:HupE/UreJ family protein [Vibrio sp. VB16]|uniref:HupE/UreJ family protein n=1 Tax=Vibrio sp. VB16 TaxID=2785746 RepID=UPI00189C77FE|nr:HupE/UreJ family protein [Vibrio sp. VB16]UGA56809.1 HupE/UreJ family protein [Vibrio sp. VB16]
MILHKKFLVALLSLASLNPTTSWAHPSHSKADIFSGILHPLTGLDHSIVMLGLGFIAVVCFQRSKIVNVLSIFLISLISGVILGMLGITIPKPELLIVMSVCFVGITFLLSASKSKLQEFMGYIATLMAAVHGYIHIIEIPSTAPVASYSLGIMLSSAVIYVLGASLGTLFFIKKSQNKIQIFSGGLYVVASVVLFI